MCTALSIIVMAGLDPAIHALAARAFPAPVDARIKSGHDVCFALGQGNRA
jgi:hypothetical protein